MAQTLSVPRDATGPCVRTRLPNLPRTGEAVGSVALDSGGLWAQ